MARCINEAGLALVKEFEGLSLRAYTDPAGVLTIGYGHVSRRIKPDMEISEHQADVILAYDLGGFAALVEDLLTSAGREATSNQFSALVSLAFNIGYFRLSKSTLMRKFLAGDVEGAAAEFMKWRLAAGKVLPGLVRRRAAERELFLRPD